MAEEQEILRDLTLEENRKAEASRAASEDDNATFFGDWADAVSRYGAAESGGAAEGNYLNIVRSQAAKAVQAVNSVFSIQATAFNTVKSFTDSVMGVFGAIQDLMSSLMALDRMLVYQLQRAASFRFRRTLNAYEASYQRIQEHLDAIDEMSDVFDGDAFNFDRLTDDWKNRVDSASESLDDALKDIGLREDEAITDEWKKAHSQLRMISTGESTDEELLRTFRRFINIYESLLREMNNFSSIDQKINQHLEDNSLFMENLKNNDRMDHLIRRAILESKTRVKAAGSQLGELSGGCRYNPTKVLHNLSAALGEIDASMIVLGKSDVGSLFNGKDSYFNLDNLGLDSPCGLVALSAYLDDIKIAKDRKPNIQAIIDTLNEYLSILALESTAGNTTGREKRKRKKDKVKSDIGKCKDWKNAADDAHTAFINEPLSGFTDGMVGPLSQIAAFGDGVEDAMGSILSAKIFSITSYREFLQMFPAGRLYLIIMDCLGVSDKLGFEGTMTWGDFSKIEGIKDKIDKLSSQVDAVTSQIADNIAQAFAWLNKLDSEIAEFIAAIVSLLFFCDKQQSFTSYREGDFTLYRSPGQKVIGDIYSDTYNSSIGDDGTSEQPIGGDQDACRCQS